jgi:hypothetical protein
MNACGPVVREKGMDWGMDWGRRREAGYDIFHFPNDLVYKR